MRALLLLLLPSIAHATGRCEDNPTRFDPPTQFSAKEHAFASAGVAAWCEVDEQNQERRGSAKFVELRDVANKVLATLSADPDASRISADKVAQLHQALVARGYGALAKVPNCGFKTAWDGDGVVVDVTRAGKRLARVPLGSGSTRRRGDQQLVVARDGEAIALWATVPDCDGPPPGYFGPDDPGTCYKRETVIAMTLDKPLAAACLK